MTAPTNLPPDRDEELLALLDEGLAKLHEKDRQAVALRYLQGRPLRDVGVALGVSEEAARKRVDRCIEKLRTYFARRGVVTASAGALAVLLGERAGEAAVLSSAARAQLASAVLHVCHGPAAVAPTLLSLAKGANAMMHVTRTKIAAAVVLAMLGLAGGWWTILQVTSGRATASPSASPAPIAAAPTTRPKPLAITPKLAPDADLSTPFTMLESLSRALKSGDAAATYACLNVDPHRSPTPMDCLFAENLVHSRWMKTWREAFPQSRMTLYQLLAADEVIDALLALAKAGGAAPMIDGDHASVALVVPDAARASFPLYTQVYVRRWSGQVIHFTRIGGEWKLDEIPMQIVDTNTAQPPHMDVNAQIAGMMAYVEALDQLSEKVRAQRVRSAAQAQLVFNYDEEQLGRAYPGMTTAISVVPLESKP
jgi:hypothetical protein